MVEFFPVIRIVAGKNFPRFEKAIPRSPDNFADLVFPNRLSDPSHRGREISNAPCRSIESVLFRWRMEDAEQRLLVFRILGFPALLAGREYSTQAGTLVFKDVSLDRPGVDT